jgi:hypothetical protein
MPGTFVTTRYSVVTKEINVKKIAEQQQLMLRNKGLIPACDLAKRMGLSVSAIRQALRRGNIEKAKVGGRVYVTVHSALRYYGGDTEEGQAAVAEMLSVRLVPRNALPEVPSGFVAVVDIDDEK